MKKQYYMLTILFGSILILAAFSNNPPNGKTGAPGEGLCTDCHAAGNPAQDGIVEITGFPDIITPEATYTITVAVKNPNGLAETAGFQMTILDASNQLAGSMSNASSNSTITSAGGKQYFEHDPAVDFDASNEAIWSVDWTAPAGPLESQVSYYASGNIANGNGQNSGDLIVAVNGNGVISQTSSTKNTQKLITTVYPNPVADILNIDTDGLPIQELSIYSASGNLLQNSRGAIDQQVDVSNYTPGMYLLRIVVDGGVETVKWVKR